MKPGEVLFQVCDRYVATGVHDNFSGKTYFSRTVLLSIGSIHSLDVDYSYGANTNGRATAEDKPTGRWNYKIMNGPVDWAIVEEAVKRVKGGLYTARRRCYWYEVHGD